MLDYQLLAICMQKIFKNYKIKKINIFFGNEEEKNKRVAGKKLKEDIILIFIFCAYI